jgi:cephalosporin hydroxylase
MTSFFSGILPNFLKLKRGSFAAPREIRQMTPAEQSATDAFHRAYYESWTTGRRTIDLSWFGYQTLKCPLDLWIYQEIIVETQPELIIECGTNAGGSALYLASICDLAGAGQVISIDIEARSDRPKHKRIQFITGSSTDPGVVATLRNKAAGRRTLVILDSDHSKAHVLAELRAYSDMVPIGCYLIVEDTNVNGHPAFPSFGPGPMEALREFLASTDAFQVDRDRERLMMTLNPSGYLKRIR